MLARLKPVTITAISLSDHVGIWITKNLVRTYDRNHHACSTPPSLNWQNEVGPLYALPSAHFDQLERISLLPAHYSE